MTATRVLALIAFLFPIGNVREAAAGDDLFGRDKALHFAASAGIALGGYGGTALFTEAERPRLLVGGGLALAAGIGKEIADRFTGGDPSWRDLGWDVVGTATGLASGWLLHRLWHHLVVVRRAG
jgi:putative lipoprotein